ncbi:MAG: Transcriptional regulator, CdaR-family [uncultured Corynebacteriales bacterium]|uniref:Transcriptional regulator, CdaR-family n=1 Tax=uncultured Mycobacteriales bacterium TaxID=581187 RepID=A0A6J4JTL7_9ACTN|nr:MAG: Transcriptional regulator, CdaR-family [uncultured Corynebacteriales bacterium]
MEPDRPFRMPTGMALDAPVAAALRARLPGVSARTVATLTAEVPEYADPLRGELGANISRAVELALATFLRLAEEPAGEDPGMRLLPALEAAYGLGRGEARSGRTMDALLAAYRVGARVAWEEWGAAALDAGLPPHSLVTFAALVFAYIDQLSAASVSGHADELATSGRVREQYLERLAVALLTGAPAEELDRRAERAGWAPPRTLTCLIGTAAYPAGPLGRAALTIAGDAVDPTLPDGVMVGLLPDVGPRRPALLRSLESRARVLGPERPWTGAAASYRRARRALDRHGPGPDVVDTEAQLADLVLTADPEALADLRAQVLRPLAGLRPDVADRLAGTLRSWLLHQGRRDDVAADLVVHPQTVRYRMTQVRGLFGDALQDPAVVRDLVVALAAAPGIIAAQPGITGP